MNENRRYRLYLWDGRRIIGNPQWFPWYRAGRGGKRSDWAYVYAKSREEAKTKMFIRARMSEADIVRLDKEGWVMAIYPEGELQERFLLEPKKIK